ncbi:2-dehydro-3-deoxy-6-phosphogalactonate aldolase [Pseudomonas sp. Q1-7]|uniref:2-dehydro-3-deoxy-6-phosphogalactonate aldolase n=1 Tax=Pseudomonas sp. Q1-7 TaxID=3020843 RepID=UPI002301E7A2|nr:2-dehydro-3-deoxy-6-phosphogalactonate aldolase [Pseudomonas sp. Q1-7]
MLNAWFDPLPLVAILRGLQPDEAATIGGALAEAGLRMLEVPLNSPQPMETIFRLNQALGDQYLIGAGTVTRAEQVDEIAAAGGRLIVMPHADTTVIRAAKDAGMLCIPGVATPTEAFAALAAGADALKLFPAEVIGQDGLKAWRAVLPADLRVLPVGGISPTTMRAWVAAGARGFGIGSALYVPGLSAAEVGRRARAFAKGWADATPQESRP